MPLIDLGMTGLVVHLHDGAVVDARGVERALEYRQRLRVSVHGWGRCDGEDGASPLRVAESALDACREARVSAYYANIEDRWEDAPDAWRTVVGSVRGAAIPVALCTYPGVGGGGHAAAREAGALALVVQSFLPGTPRAFSAASCVDWGRRHGWLTVVPMLGVFRDSFGVYPDAAALAHEWGDLPRHCYPVEQALDGEFAWAALAAE